MRTSTLDALIEGAVVHGQLAAGISPRLVAARSSLGRRGVAVLAGRGTLVPLKGKAPAWSTWEDEFLEQNLGVLTESEIGEVLGRSDIAVHLRWRRDLRLPAPSKNPLLLTCSQIANGLQKDSKSIAMLIDRGILEGHRLPSERTLRLVDRKRLLSFLTNPMNWVYFDPMRVGRTGHHIARGEKSYDREFWQYARRLVRKRMTLWKDKWLRIGEVAQVRGVSISGVNKAIREGRLKAVDWGNWWVMRSDALAAGPLQFWQGKGGKGVDRLGVSPRAQAFIVVAEALGLEQREIACLMKWKEKRVAFYLQKLRKEGRIPKIIREEGLKVFYEKRTRRSCASWRAYLGRFPHFARKVSELRKKDRLSRSEAKYFGRVMKRRQRYNEFLRRRRATA